MGRMEQVHVSGLEEKDGQEVEVEEKEGLKRTS